MELNAEQIKKALDWLDSLVGNSNDSEIALFTYQLLGILYDTCEELTEENERLRAEVSVKKKLLYKCVDLEDRVKADTVRKMQERLKAKSEIVYGDRAICVELIDQIAKEMLEGEK